MSKDFKWFLCIMFACFLMSCAHTGGRETAVSQKTPDHARGNQGTPSIQVAETTYEFGEIAAEFEVIHDFKFRNVGTGVLEIKKVKPG